jgi:hypothetical protein
MRSPAAAQVRDVAHGALRLDAVPNGEAVQVAAHLAAVRELGVDPRLVHLRFGNGDSALPPAAPGCRCHIWSLRCAVASSPGQAVHDGDLHSGKPSAP